VPHVLSQCLAGCMNSTTNKSNYENVKVYIKELYNLIIKLLHKMNFNIGTHWKFGALGSFSPSFTYSQHISAS
jgi:hypothetical protein